MLDLKFIRENPDVVRQGIENKNEKNRIDEVLELDKKRREILVIADDLKSKVHAILDKHGLDYDLAWTLGGKPFLTPRGSLVAAMEAAVFDTLALKPALSTTGGTSDGRFIAEICPQVVEFGPVNATIHKLNECIAIDAVAPLSAIYRRTLENLLSASEPA
ncbi:M20/M25/M40 family metallo-hydrolase [Zoogloea sp.]|uniref:M20/M25/M40 family metallo-hydrolase n=1 Tax=Zoogloea sp. TaxID=49181 RepID=UPI001ACC1E44|nr:M20/M25/M40 family metallo-hydrolase [Zoogloea sp.]MBN8281546.1 M20/M25/M40 family metallo-hydrolase [Zoogloea sp.]